MTADWTRLYPQAKMKREHGSRFSHVSHNAVTALMFFDELVLFAHQNSNSKKLQTLSNQVQENEDLIKSELQAIAACWFLIISPLWITLRKSHAQKSLKLIDDFTSFATAIQAQSSLEPSLKVKDPWYNDFMYINSENDEFDDTSLEGKLVAMVQNNHKSTRLNQSIKMMLKAASTYMLKLSNNWLRECIPDASVSFPFSNQVHILMFILC
jgi:hypothetical protein